MKKVLPLLFLTLIVTEAFATKATNFSGTYRNGQVFFSWTNISNSEAQYKLYRSSNKIKKGSQLAAAEYLGYTVQTSALNNNLTDHDGTDKYFIIQTGGSALLSTQGLFVTTSVVNASYFYALTTVVNNVEDTSITVGTNSLSASIAETVSNPLPVLQETRTISNKPVEIYADFISSRVESGGPLRITAGWLGYDFAFYRNNATTPQALHMRFPAGGTDFLNAITKCSGSEVNLGVSDDFPDAGTSGWIGTNEAHDPFNDDNNAEWTTGTNYFYTVERITHELDWVIANCPVDSNRVYVEGTSYGATGAFLYALLRPEKIAAAVVTLGIFNFGFQNDYNPECKMNATEKNRIDGNKILGTLGANLPEESGLPTYDLLNGGLVIHQYNSKNRPVMYSVNGRNDTLLGWTEKPIWYDSVNRNHVGGYYFYDLRDHSGAMKAWVLNFDMYRYRKDLSYPAFSNCSLNNNPGDGHAENGDSVGTVNGFLDWSSSITDNSTTWSAKIYTRPLEKINSLIVPAPASCTTDISLRRVQQFKPAAGTQLNWAVVHNGQQIQSGSVTSNGTLVTVTGIQVYSDTVTFQITVGSVLNTYYRDADGDGYGNAAITTQAATQPSGYVSNNTDCNDSNASVHSAPSPAVSPSGNISACKKTDVVLTANAGAGLSYQWYLDNVAISGATHQTYTSGGSEAGSYTVKETNTGSCYAYSAPTTLSRMSLPKAGIQVTGSLDICGTGSVLLVEVNGVGPSYQWYKGANPISGATNVSYTATTTGSYKVMVTKANGCSKMSMKVSVTSSCRDQQALSSPNSFSVEASPNPATDRVYLSIYSEGNEARTATVQLLNLVAQPVLTSTIMIDGNNSPHSLSLAGVHDGVYFIKVVMEGKTFVRPLVVERK